MSFGASRDGPPDLEGMVSLKVDNLTFRTTVDELVPIFEKFGKVGDIFIPRDRESRRSRGFAFVRFYDQDDAEAAVEAVDRKSIDGREVTVQIAKYSRPANQAPKSRRERSSRSPERERHRDRLSGRDRDRDRHHTERRGESHDRYRPASRYDDDSSRRSRYASPPPYRRRSYTPPPPMPRYGRTPPPRPPPPSYGSRYARSSMTPPPRRRSYTPPMRRY